MGAWDYGPFGNDDASDFWYTIREAKNPMKELERALTNHKSGYENERRAAAAFVAFLDKFDRRSLSRFKKLSIKALRELLADDGFTYDWKDTPILKRRLRKEIKNLGG